MGTAWRPSRTYERRYGIFRKVPETRRPRRDSAGVFRRIMAQRASDHPGGPGRLEGWSASRWSARLPFVTARPGRASRPAHHGIAMIANERVVVSAGCLVVEEGMARGGGVGVGRSWMRPHRCGDAWFCRQNVFMSTASFRARAEEEWLAGWDSNPHGVATARLTAGSLTIRGTCQSQWCLAVESNHDGPGFNRM